MSLDYLFNLIVFITLGALDKVWISYLLVNMRLCFIAVKLILKEHNDTLSFKGYFYRVRHLLVLHPLAIDDLLDSPSLSWVLL
jgi:hypothetical protein